MVPPELPGPGYLPYGCPHTYPSIPPRAELSAAFKASVSRSPPAAPAQDQPARGCVWRRRGPLSDPAGSRPPDSANRAPRPRPQPSVAGDLVPARKPCLQSPAARPLCLGPGFSSLPRRRSARSCPPRDSRPRSPDPLGPSMSQLPEKIQQEPCVSLQRYPPEPSPGNLAPAEPPWGFRHQLGPQDRG